MRPLQGVELRCIWDTPHISCKTQGLWCQQEMQLAAMGW